MLQDKPKKKSHFFCFQMASDFIYFYLSEFEDQSVLGYLKKCGHFSHFLKSFQEKDAQKSLSIYKIKCCKRELMQYRTSKSLLNILF